MKGFKVANLLRILGTMGDGSLILLGLVIKDIPPPLGVSWVFRDQKLSVKYQNIGFMLTF